MNRRSFLGVAGTGVLALAGLALTEMRSPAVQAARRPTPTPKPQTCPGIQVPVNGVCTCPADQPKQYKCGPDCCATKEQCCDNACCGEGLVCADGGGFGICVPAA